MRRKNLNTRDDLDFAYLLELMRPLSGIDEYVLLPELFALLGYENVLKLCKYAGGEVIKIPTISELYDSLHALQIFYDVYIKKTKLESSIPEDIVDKVQRIKDIYSDA